MKRNILLFLICFSFLSCDLFTDKKDDNEEPPYTVKIAWDSGLHSNDYQSHTVYDDGVYFYERPPGYDTVNIYALTRLDAKTGALIWRSNVLFSNIQFCQPVVIGGYVYVLLEPNIIWCFNRETGEHTATFVVEIEKQNFRLKPFVTVYQDYLYLGLWNLTRDYFVRLDANEITQQGNPETMQKPVPEVLWEPDGVDISAKPVIYNNTVFTGTRTYGTEKKPVELAGFDIDTKEMVFHTAFGGPEDVSAGIPFPEDGPRSNPIFIHDDVLYYLSWSINAWDLKTGKRLYRHVFTRNIPDHKWYDADTLQAVFYKNNIYYTSGDGSGLDGRSEWRNIQCIDAATGKLVWNASPKYSETLDTNPIIAHGKLYVGVHRGMHVYEPETGKLIGVDKSFCGAGMGRNVLYNDYMICVRAFRDTGDAGKLVAVYVGE